eukprot:gene2078-18261_t
MDLDDEVQVGPGLAGGAHGAKVLGGECALRASGICSLPPRNSSHIGSEPGVGAISGRKAARVQRGCKEERLASSPRKLLCSLTHSHFTLSHLLTMRAALRAQPTRQVRSASAQPSAPSTGRNVCCNAMKLYSNPMSRGRILEWYIQELGEKAMAEVEVVNMDLKEKEHKADWFLEVNPFAKVPAFSDGDVNLFESGAILMYLANKYGDCPDAASCGIAAKRHTQKKIHYVHTLHPLDLFCNAADKYGDCPDAASRGIAAKWTLFGNSTLVNSMFVEQFRETQMPATLGTLDAYLSTREYLEGDFSVSDVAVGAYLLYVPAFLPNVDLSPYPNVLAYMARLAARPACAATVASRATEKKKETEAAAS